jgi:hypothetical protein
MRYGLTIACGLDTMIFPWIGSGSRGARAGLKIKLAGKAESNRRDL